MEITELAVPVQKRSRRMAKTAAVLSLDEAIKKLATLQVDAGHSILSIYLQTQGQEHAQRKRVRVFVDQMLRSKPVTDLVQKSRDWKEKIERIAGQADVFLNDKEKASFHGIAFFANERDSEILTYASYLPLPNDYYSMDFPALGPLVSLRDQYEPLCMCSFNQEEAHLFQLRDGLVSQSCELGQEVYPHHKQGGWAQARFQRKHDEDVEHFFRQVAHELEQVAVKNSAIKFAMLGQRKELPLLRKYLPDQVQRRLIAEEVVDRRLNNGQLAQKGLEIIAHFEREQEKEDIAKLSLGRIAQGYGTVTREKVFRAINQGQVDTLLLKKNIDESGAIVLSTHTILEKFRQNSPYDGDPVSVAPLREILVYETIRHNGRVQWLPTSANGNTPAYGVLYRSRGSIDFKGN